MSSSFLSKFKQPIEKALADSIHSFGPKTVLRDAIEYALKNGGKRFRPAIVYLVAEALGAGKDVTEAGVAVEFFHTASLIADDLPCMDDDDERREHPSVHKVYGEATALLATYALIAAGYDYIQMAAKKVGREQICPLVIENASYNTGIFGATGGQHEDLFPSDLTEEKVLSAIDKKTGTLFEISFVFGWLYGGGEVSELSLVKAAARSFGRAFQISDDFLDLDQDNGVNYPAIAGAQKAFVLLGTELDFYKQALKKLRLETPELIGLAKLVEKRIAQTPASSFF